MLKNGAAELFAMACETTSFVYYISHHTLGGAQSHLIVGNASELIATTNVRQLDTRGSKRNLV